MESRIDQSWSKKRKNKDSQIERIRQSEAIERTDLEKWSSGFRDSCSKYECSIKINEKCFLDEITARGISRLQDDLVKKKGFSDSSVNRCIAAFKTVLKLAIGNGK